MGLFDQHETAVVAIPDGCSYHSFLEEASCSNRDHLFDKIR